MLQYITSTPAIACIIIIFLVSYDDIVRYWRKFLSQKETFSITNKFAKVKELSDDAKDIEKFIMANAAFLSESSVIRLIARIDSLKNDRVIMDDNLKKRIADISESDEELPYADFGKAMIRATVKKG